MHPRFMRIVVSLVVVGGLVLPGCGGDSSPANSRVDEVAFNDTPDVEVTDDPGETPVDTNPTVAEVTPLAAPSVHAGQAVMGSDSLTMTGRVWSTPVRAQGSTYVLTGGI